MRAFTEKTTYEDILNFKKSDIQKFLREQKLPVSGSQAVVARRTFDYIQLNFGVNNSVEDTVEDGATKEPKTTDINKLNFGWYSDLQKLSKITHKDVEKYLITSSHKTEDQEKMNCYRQFIWGYNFSQRGLYT